MTEETGIEKTQNAELEAVERAVLGGDLSKLSAAQRVIYYRRYCEEVGVSWVTQPFDWIVLQGKLVLYAKKSCAEQLRKKYGISLTLLGEGIEKHGDILLYTVRVAAVDATGRTDYDVGSVNITGRVGDDLSNAILKAHTKAKRRATLSISGVGLPDESELDSIPSARTPQFNQLSEPQIREIVPPRRESEEKVTTIGAETSTSLGPAVSTHQPTPGAPTRFVPSTPPVTVNIKVPRPKVAKPE